MAITAMGLGTKAAPANTNLDPQAQFWSFLSAFAPDKKNGIISGFSVTQTDPAGLKVQVGGAQADIDGGRPDAAVLNVNGRKVLISSDGHPQEVTIPTAPTSGSRIDAIVSYVDMTDVDASKETPGTPAYIKTIVVSGTAASSPSAPTDAQIIAKLPAAAGSSYLLWGTVTVGEGATQVVNSDITAGPRLGERMATATFGIGGDARMTAVRVGNIVVTRSSGGSNYPAGFQDPTETIPLGFRPAAEVWVTGLETGSFGAGLCAYGMRPNGTMGRWSANANASDTQMACTWITNDPWPTD